MSYQCIFCDFTAANLNQFADHLRWHQDHGSNTEEAKIRCIVEKTLHDLNASANAMQQFLARHGRPGTEELL